MFAKKEVVCINRLWGMNNQSRVMLPVKQINVKTVSIIPDVIYFKLLKPAI